MQRSVKPWSSDIGGSSPSRRTFRNNGGCGKLVKPADCKSVTLCGEHWGFESLSTDLGYKKKGENKNETKTRQTIL